MKILKTDVNGGLVNKRLIRKIMKFTQLFYTKKFALKSMYLKAFISILELITHYNEF